MQSIDKLDETQEKTAEHLNTTRGHAHSVRPVLGRHLPRGIYIVQEGKGGPIFRIDTPESYANSRTLTTDRVSNLKKLQRIRRIRKVGYRKRLATNRDVRLFGPAIVMGEDAAA